MSEETWPADLPRCPTADSLSGYQPETTVVGFEPDVGPALTHERATVGGARAQFAWKMTHAQMVSFHNWYVYSLRRGSRTFRMHDPMMNEPAVWKIQVGTAPTYDRIASRYWRVMLSLYRMP